MARADRGASSWDELDESDVRVRANKKGSRPRTKERPAYEDAVIGRIVAVDRGRFTAVVDESSDDERLVTAVRAKQLRRTPIVAGDRVGLVGDVSGRPDTLARLRAWLPDGGERERILVDTPASLFGFAGHGPQAA